MDSKFEIKIQPTEDIQTPLTLNSLTDNIKIVIGGKTLNEYFFTAPFECQIVTAFEIHGTAGTDAGAVTLDIQNGGTSILASTFNLKGAVDTVQEVAPSATLSARQIDRGDSLKLVTSGVLTAVAGVTVTVVLKTDLKNLIG